jgi:hypothetical protein
MTNMTEQEFSDWLQEAFKTVGKKLPDDGSLDFDNAYYDNSRPFPAWVVPIFGTRIACNISQAFP